MSFTKRLFVGGLFIGVNEKDLRDRFQSFGAIKDIDIRTKKDSEGEIVKTFAYLSLHGTEKDFKKCVSTLNKCKWKGNTLQIETAKESFLNRLKEEQSSPVDSKSQKPKKDKKAKATKDLLIGTLGPRVTKPDQTKWVRGHAGKLVPILNLKQPHSNKTLRHDPTKNRNAVKKLLSSNKDHLKTRVNDLTWSIEEQSSNISPGNRHKVHISSSESSDSDSEEIQNSKKSVVDIPENLNLKNSSSGCKKENTMGKLNKKSSISALNKCDKVSDAIYISDSNDSVEITQVTHVLPERKLNESIKNRSLIKDSVQKKKGNNKSPVIVGNESETITLSDSFNTDDDTVSPKINSKVHLSRTENLKNSSDSESDAPDIEAFMLRKDVPVNDKSSDKQVDTNSTSKKRKISKVKPEISEQTNDISSVVEDATEGKPMKLNQMDYKSENKHKLKNQSVSEGSKELIVTTAATYNSDDETSEDDHFVGGKRLKLAFGLSSMLNRNKPMSNSKSSLSSSAINDEHLTSGSSVSENQPASIDSFNNIESEEEDILDAIAQGKWKKIENLKKGSVTMNTSHNLGNSSKKVTINKQLDNTVNAKEKKRRKASRNSNSKSSDDVNSDENSSDESDSEDNETSEARNDIVAKAYHSNTDSEIGSDGADDSDTSSSDASSNDSANESDNGKGSTVATASGLVKANKGTNVSSNVMEAGSSDDDDESSETRNSSVAKAYHSNTDSENEAVVAPKSHSKMDKENKDKHEASNKQRLDTVKEKLKQVKQKKALLQKALSNVDLVSTNKKIVFESDTENETEPKINSKDAKLTSKIVAEMTNAANKMSLFHNDDGSDTSENDGKDMADNDDNERFEIKPQFEGKRGAKLMQLQSKFVNDDRFKIDSRFAESDTSDSEMEQETSATADEEEKSESQKNLEVLEQVLGKKVGSFAKEQKQKKVFKDINLHTYDPTKKAHEKFEIKQKEVESKSPVKEKKKVKKNIKDEKDAEPPIDEQVSKEQFYEVTDSIKDLFQKNKDDKEKDTTQNCEAMDSDNYKVNQPFSLLKMFGNNEDVEDKALHKENVVAKWEPVQSMPWETKNPANDEKQPERKSKKEADGKTMTSANTETFFFFSESDKRLTEGVEFFHRKLPLEEVKREWLQRRPQLVDDYKLKRKRALRKKREMERFQAKFKQKKRFLQKRGSQK